MTTLPTLSTSPPPSDRQGLAAWLIEQEEVLAAAARDVLVGAVRSAVSRFLGVQAAGDPSALDGIVSSWSTFLSTDFMPMLETISLAASVGAFNTSPDVPDSLVPGWTNVVNRDAVAWASTATNRLRNVGDDVWQQVRTVTADALQSGHVGEELTQTIHDLTTWTEERADTVARTSVLGAYANGTHAGNDALGTLGPAEHYWDAVIDGRTRPAHVDANNQVRKWGQPFDVGGESMLYPHALGASAGNTISCRCVEGVLYPGDRRPDGSIVEGEQAAGVQTRNGMGDAVPVPSTIEHPTGSHVAHIDPATGRWTPERQRLHDNIVRSQVDGMPAQDRPEMLFMGGGGGAGKTTTIKAGLIDRPRGAVTVNSDDYKELLPEAQAMQAAGDNRWARFTHEESSYLSKRVQAAAVERRISVTMDAVGSDPGKVSSQVAAARQAGYAVRAAYVSIDPVDGLRRAADRARRAAARGEPIREINPAVVLKAHLDANAAWESVARVVDEAVLLDNSTVTPFTIATMRGGNLTIDDLAGWAVYQARRRDDWLAERPGFSFGDEELMSLLSAAVASGPVEYRLSQAQMSAIARLSLERVQELANLAAETSHPPPLTSDEQLAFDACRAAVDAFPGVAWSPLPDL